MPGTTLFNNSQLLLFFNATTFANIAINATSGPLTVLYVSLHTSDPGNGGDQTTNEIAYTSYARVSVARTGSGWVVTNNSCSPANNIAFPAGTGGSGTATYWGIGSAASGAGVLYMRGVLAPSIVCGNGIQPIVSTASTITLT